MSTETELKLSLASDHVAWLLNSPLLASPPARRQLRNTYFALDRNIVVQRNGRQARAPICELELELKGGDPEAPNTLAHELGQAAPLTGADASKAERGYALFHSLA